MKLIDLLVQELPKRGGWPKGAAKSAKIPGDTYVWFFKENGEPHQSYPAILAEPLTFKGSIEDVTREFYEAALAASQQPAWNGKGLPPVGIKCLTVGPHGDDSFYECTILAHTEFSGKPVAVFQYGDIISHSSAQWFKPLATKAERKRDEAIRALQLDEAKTGVYILEVEAEAIYDAIAAGEIPGVKIDDI